MHLKKEQVAKLAQKITGALKKADCRFKVDENRIRGKIEAIIQNNIDQESAIEAEVRKLMEKFRDQMASGSVDPQRAYQMIKKQVAKERNFIL
ncbi:MAG: DUF507 family protein [Deltaproteobacteria bacterium]|nr:DUF507 family protein [Deltaproteobacteria bacterium]MBI4373382.1 DUF507 family protein [Deltaproteobacteria bacterium]